MNGKRRTSRSGQRFEDVSVIYVSTLKRPPVTTSSLHLNSCRDIHSWMRKMLISKAVNDKENLLHELQEGLSFSKSLEDYGFFTTYLLLSSDDCLSVPRVLLFVTCIPMSIPENVGRKCFRIQGTSKDDHRDSSTVFCFSGK